MPKERSLEERFIDWCKAHSVWTLKLAALSGGGFPDRSCLKDGKICFIELKREDKKGKIGPLQKWFRKKLTEHGFVCIITDSFEEATETVRKTLLDGQ